MRELLRVLVLIAALLIAAVGTPLAIIGIAIGLLSGGPDAVMMVTLSVSVLALSLGFGSAAAWHAWRAIQRHRSAAFRPKMPWLLLLLFLVVLVLGHVVLSYSILPALVFPPLHVAASVLPPLFILAVFSHALPRVTTWRHVVLQISGGAFLAAPLAMVLETVAILLIATAAITGLSLQPGGQELLITASSHLQDPTWLPDPSDLMHALLAPVIVAAGIAVVAGLIPLVEEVVKTVGVALTVGRRPSLPQSLLWGLAAGAGFSIAEGLLNSAGALGAWLPTVLLRLGATLLHCLTGALMGLAWNQLVVRRRWARALGLYLASVAIHGLWNGLAAATALLSVTTSDIGMDTDGQLAVSLGMLITFLLLVLLALSMIGGLAGLAIHVRRSTALDETPSSEELEPAAPDPVAPSRPGTEA